MSGAEAARELFGREGSEREGQYQGLFELAQGGSVLLDEVGALDPDGQAKLLRVLEERQVVRVDGVRRRAVDVRLIATSPVPLESLVEAGSFRADLYYRLKVVRLELPPLCQRKEDIPALAEHFLESFQQKYGKSTPALDDVLVEHLSAWHWPGNIRELSHTVESLVLTGDLPDFKPTGDPTEPEAGGSSSGVHFDFGERRYSLDFVERRLVEDALAHAGGNVSEAARLLGLTRGALRHRLERWGKSP